jgi:hypothetical protein
MQRTSRACGCALPALVVGALLLATRKICTTNVLDVWRT